MKKVICETEKAFMKCKCDKCINKRKYMISQFAQSIINEIIFQTIKGNTNETK